MLRVAARDADEQIHLAAQAVRLDDLGDMGELTVMRGRSAWRTMTLMNASIGKPRAADEMARS